MPNEEKLGREHRKYIRLDSVFPVQFRLISLYEKNFLSDWIQGFTNNIGHGGICLAVNNLSPELARLLKEQKARLFLEIEMPVIKKPVSAQARAIWVQDKPDSPNKYLIGLIYDEINPSENSKIMRYAIARKLFAPALFSIILALSLGFAINSFINMKLIRGNKALVEQLVKNAQESSLARQKIEEIAKDKEDLKLKIHALQLRIKTAEEEQVKTEELKNLTEQLTQEKDALQEELSAIQRQENIVAGELQRLDKRKLTLVKANFDKMYLWLKVHQNPRTGLVMSFEGDSEIANWAFIYDQSLAAQAYTNFSDFEGARRILDFFAKKAKRVDGRFVNAYYTNDGTPAEYTVNSGPNIWVGIAIAHYTKKTQDTSYVSLAEEIADSTINLQALDKEGGIRGGPDVEWYSTEHNLDAYAFFNMLYKITGKSKYRDAAGRVLNWLVGHTYGKADLPVKRGKGDSSIATDTYAWSIAAIGPEKLEELGMNPDRIVEFAEQNCSVTVSYARPEGRAIAIKGFDFTPQRNLARGGVVSSEWTAQMVMAFKIMANFYYNKGMLAKAGAYALKADEYLSSLSNMIISSPSPSGQGESCLPYATQEAADTGHGWFTPKGKSTGSVAGTASALFAYYNYNPLELKE